jgi:hypothetical protein
MDTPASGENACFDPGCQPDARAAVDEVIRRWENDYSLARGSEPSAKEYPVVFGSLQIPPQVTVIHRQTSPVVV